MPADYSIIVPAYNEEAILDENLQALKQVMASSPLKGELIVTDNNSSDRTSNIAYAAGARVVFEMKNQISKARNTGAKHAEGRYLLFVDADTRIPAGLLQTALERLESGKFCGGGACVDMTPELEPPAKRVLKFWNGLSRTLGVASGCFIYCRRDDYKAAGGFSEKVYASEEIWFSYALKRAGKKAGRKFAIIDQPRAITSSRKQGWYSDKYHLLLIIMLVFFPFMVRFKKACSYWYQRPEG